MNMKSKILQKLEKIGLFIGLFLIFLFSDLIYLVPFHFLKIDYDKLSYNLQSLF